MARKLTTKDIEIAPIPNTSKNPHYYIATRQRQSQSGRDCVNRRGQPRFYTNRYLATEAAQALLNGGVVNIEGILQVNEIGWVLFPFTFQEDKPHDYPDTGSW